MNKSFANGNGASSWQGMSPQQSQQRNSGFLLQPLAHWWIFVNQEVLAS
jgi:hypothetical protein